MVTEEQLTEVRQCIRKTLICPNWRFGWMYLSVASLYLLAEWIRWWRHPHYSSLPFLQGGVYAGFLWMGFMQLQNHLFGQRLEAILNGTGTAKTLTWWTRPKLALLLIIVGWLVLGVLDLFMR